MTSLPEQVNILQMLAKNEEAVGRLYEVYANKFREHEEFWFGLAMEEADHANRVLELIQKVNKGSASVSEGTFKVEDIQKFSNYLKEQLDRARHESMSFVEALSIALNIEKSLIERKFFRIFEGGSEENWHVLEYLASATENHIKVIQKKLEQQKKFQTP